MIKLQAVVIKGHQVASGQTKDSPFPKGTIEMQVKSFAERGLDISGFYWGTINVSIAPKTFVLKNPELELLDVKWSKDWPAENFRLTSCSLSFQGKNYQAMIYQPDPTTKVGHFQDDSTLEILAPFINNLTYGSLLTLSLNPQRIAIYDND